MLGDEGDGKGRREGWTGMEGGGGTGRRKEGGEGRHEGVEALGVLGVLIPTQGTLRSGMLFEYIMSRRLRE